MSAAHVITVVKRRHWNYANTGVTNLFAIAGHFVSYPCSLEAGQTKFKTAGLARMLRGPHVRHLCAKWTYNAVNYRL